MSMYAVNPSIPKTLVRYLVKYVAEKESTKEVAHTLLDILDTPVSPELLPKGEAFKDDYSEEEIDKWLDKFIYRFFTQQFKRSALPDGPKVGSISLSPRGDWRMPSDASFNCFK